MENKKQNTTIRITAETRQRITIHNFRDLPGTKKENILCGLLVNLCASDQPLTVKEFLMFYDWFVTTLYQGIEVDLKTHPAMEGSALLQEALLIKGDETENLINKASFVKVATMISGDDELFVEEAGDCFTHFEAMLLLSAFFPGSPVG